MKRKTGYLYAIDAGWVPNSIGEFQLRIKLGSTRCCSDPVGALQHRYGTCYGLVNILWLEPSASARRDERKDLFAQFADKRLWQNHELFRFTDIAHFQREVGRFTTGFRIRTGGEQEHKPSAVCNLSQPRFQSRQRLREQMRLRLENNARDEDTTDEDAPKPRVKKGSAAQLAAGKRNYAKYRLKQLQQKTLAKLNSGDPKVEAKLQAITIEKHRCRFDATTQQWVGDQV